MPALSFRICEADSPNGKKVLLSVVRIDFAVCVDDSVGWHADGYGILILMQAPLQHGEILFLAGRGEINHVRDVADERDVEEAKMCHIVHGRQ